MSSTTCRGVNELDPFLHNASWSWPVRSLSITWQPIQYSSPRCVVDSPINFNCQQRVMVRTNRVSWTTRHRGANQWLSWVYTMCHRNSNAGHFHDTSVVNIPDWFSSWCIMGCGCSMMCRGCPTTHHGKKWIPLAGPRHIVVVKITLLVLPMMHHGVLHDVSWDAQWHVMGKMNPIGWPHDTLWSILPYWFWTRCIEATWTININW